MGFGGPSWRGHISTVVPEGWTSGTDCRSFRPYSCSESEKESLRFFLGQHVDVKLVVDTTKLNLDQFFESGLLLD